MSLYGYILTTTQDLNIREQFKQIIQFLKGPMRINTYLKLKIYFIQNK